MVVATREEEEWVPFQAANLFPVCQHAFLRWMVFNHPNYPRMLQIVVAATPNLAGTTQRLCGGAIINLRCNSEINRLIDCRLDSIAKALNFS